MKQRSINHSRLVSLLILYLTLAVSTESSAQIIAPDTTMHHFVELNTGYDHNLLVIDVAYKYYIPKLKTAPFLRIAQGTALIGSGNYRIQTGMESWYGSFSKFNLRSSLSLLYVRAKNRTGNFDGIGINVQLNPGILLKNTGIGLDFQYNPIFATHIKHSDYWREFFYADVRDGWYNLTSQNVRLGAYFSQLLDRKQTLEVNLRAGHQTSGQFDKLIPGFYLILGVNKKIK